MTKRKGPKEWSPLKRFILTGDILHPGSVVVEAKDLKEALRKADAGDFEVYDEERRKYLAFQWNGDEATVEIDE